MAAQRANISAKWFTAGWTESSPHLQWLAAWQARNWVRLSFLFSGWLTFSQTVFQWQQERTSRPKVSFSSGKATCTTSLLALGSHPITAVYSGDTNYLGNTSNQVDQVVNVGLSIADVSLSEGNSGTTTLSFTVSLSVSAPVGGVTFDITTADSTASAGNDDAPSVVMTSATTTLTSVSPIPVHFRTPQHAADAPRKRQLRL